MRTPLRAKPILPSPRCAVPARAPDRGPSRTGSRLPAAIGLLAVAAASLGCSYVLAWAGMPILYEAAPEAHRELLDVPYRIGRDAVPKQRLDLFAPEGEGWPVLVFVHGGGWRSGDRALTVAGREVYRNIGRFYAAHGIGVVLPSYRLQPDVDWRAQVSDVADAVAWARANVGGYGGNPDALFLSGHSAGGHLSGFVGLDAEALPSRGVPAESVCGVIPISGAALDLNDAETWALGASPAYYEERFGDGSPVEQWRHAASVVDRIAPGSPPALILYAEGEGETLIRQAHALHAGFEAAGRPSALVEVPGEDHQRIVLTLSRGDKTAGPAILDFVRNTPCGTATTAAGG